MNQTDPTAPIRIPIGRNVTYAVRGMPAVPNAYGPGFLIPTEVSLTYRAAEDSQLGRFHAYVKGQWLREGEVVPSGEKLPGQHYHGDLSDWPEWLAEEARLHDPEPAASAVVSPPTDRAAVRDRIAAGLSEARRNGLGGMTEAEAVAHMADAVLAVLGEPTDRAAVYAEVADRLAADAEQGDKDGLTRIYRRSAARQVRAWSEQLRRLAVEAHDTGTQQQPDTEAPTLPDRLEAALTERFTELGNPYSRMVVHEKGPDGWPATHPVGPAKVAEVLRELLADEPAPVAQQPETEETDEERADREATERDHARGDHTYCGITCETEMPTEHLRNFVIAKGYPGTGGALDELLRRARVEVAEQQPAAEAEQDDTMHACPGRWGGPNCHCFDAEPAPAEQQAAAADGEETQRCAHTDIVYGRCVLPIPHDGECVHERQPRCAMPSPDGQHSCVLPPNHEWLHADKHLAEVMPNGSRVVWETPIAEPPSA